MIDVLRDLPVAQTATLESRSWNVAHGGFRNHLPGANKAPGSITIWRVGIVQANRGYCVPALSAFGLESARFKKE
jgi:hypothetical protein